MAFCKTFFHMWATWTRNASKNYLSSMSTKMKSTPWLKTYCHDLIFFSPSSSCPSLVPYPIYSSPPCSPSVTFLAVISPLLFFFYLVTCVSIHSRLPLLFIWSMFYLTRVPGYENVTRIVLYLLVESTFTIQVSLLVLVFKSAQILCLGTVKSLSTSPMFTSCNESQNWNYQRTQITCTLHASTVYESLKGNLSEGLIFSFE